MLPFCSKATGKCGEGVEVSQRRKSLCTSSGVMCSTFSSSTGIQDGDRWQFWVNGLCYWRISGYYPGMKKCLSCKAYICRRTTEHWIKLRKCTTIYNYHSYEIWNCLNWNGPKSIAIKNELMDNLSHREYSTQR